MVRFFVSLQLFGLGNSSLNSDSSSLDQNEYSASSASSLANAGSSPDASKPGLPGRSLIRMLDETTAATAGLAAAVEDQGASEGGAPAETSDTSNSNSPEQTDSGFWATLGKVPALFRNAVLFCWEYFKKVWNYLFGKDE